MAQVQKAQRITATVLRTSETFKAMVMNKGTSTKIMTRIQHNTPKSQQEHTSSLSTTNSIKTGASEQSDGEKITVQQKPEARVHETLAIIDATEKQRISRWLSYGHGCPAKGVMGNNRNSKLTNNKHLIHMTMKWSDVMSKITPQTEPARRGRATQQMNAKRKRNNTFGKNIMQRKQPTNDRIIF